jgi:hypothetical protein
MIDKKKKSTLPANEAEPEKKNNEGKTLKKKLFAEYPNLWDKASADDRDAAFAFAEEYKNFLDIAKTEREFVTVAVETLESLGFSPLCEFKSLKAGDKVYKSIHGKGLVAAVAGKRPVGEGINLVGAHVDSPRLDLKPNPVYEDADLTFLKTHYYGGIKKYQWPAIPLALHGLIFRADGSPLTLCIGEAPEDPVLTITDLLPHLGADQMSRKATEVIKGEDLNVLIGGLPFSDPELAGRFKLGILQLLNDQHGLLEKDFVSAEIEIVPAGKARDVGLIVRWSGLMPTMTVFAPSRHWRRYWIWKSRSGRSAACCLIRRKPAARGTLAHSLVHMRMYCWRSCIWLSLVQRSSTMRACWKTAKCCRLT